jgi:hypothetical protein
MAFWEALIFYFLSTFSYSMFPSPVSKAVVMLKLEAIALPMMS